MWDAAFLSFLRRAVRAGTLDLTMPGGRTHRFGAGDPAVAIRLSDRALPRKLILNPEMALGEGYVDGSLTIAGEDVAGLVALLARNSDAGHFPRAIEALRRARKGARIVTQWNPARRARRNVEHHYDLSAEFYALFLDADRQYSCGYFRSPQVTLEQAQIDKKAHIARKLLLRPGLHVLDIGSGWGGMALSLARDHGVRVTGITLSPGQLAVAQARATEAGLADRVTFRLQDYRDLDEPFDRVVSVGMMEHVGQPHYAAYFATIARVLAPDGVALIHSIGRTSPPGGLSPWFRKYIFPGGYCPAFSEVAPAIENSHLRLADLEVWRGHYERTLQHWRARFETNLPQIRAMYDERFIRMWRYYLASAELSFSEQHQVVFQMQLSHGRYTVPATRDYLYP